MTKKLFLFILLVAFLFNPIVYAEDTQNLINIHDSDIADNIEDNYYVDQEDEYHVNSETDYVAIINDYAQLLTDLEKEKLIEKMMPLTYYGHVAFVSVNYNETDVMSFAEDYYHYHFEYDSGTIFVIDMDNRDIAIFSDGHNYRVITSSKAYSITDNVYQYASDEDYYGCAEKAFDQINQLLRGEKIEEPMRYMSIAFISMTIAFFITFIFVLLKTKIKPLTDKQLLKNCNVSFKRGKVTVTPDGSHKVYSPPSSSSGGYGGGSGFSGGGGHSSGGGGGSFHSGGGGSHHF